MLASYNPEYGAKFFWNKSVYGGWHNPFGNINWRGNISDSIMPELVGLDKLDSIKIMNNDLGDLIKNYGLVQGEGLNFVQSIKEGNVSLQVGETALQGYQRSLVATSVKTKALSLATKALSTIGWVAAITAATWAIGKLFEGLDALVTTTEEHKEKLSNLKSEYSELTSEIESVNDELKTTQDKIKELDGKGSLTFTEQEELDRLIKQNNELQRQNDLLEANQKRKAEEKNKEFVESMESAQSDLSWKNWSNSAGNGYMETPRAIEDALEALPQKQRLFLDIMRYAGVRSGETLALTSDDIDFDDKTINVNKNLEFVKSEYRIKCAVANIDNERYENYEISFTPHMCRHTYATDIYYAGIDVKTAQYLLGHSCINITLDVYTHLDKMKIKDSIYKINEYLSQSKISQMGKMGYNEVKEKTA